MADQQTQANQVTQANVIPTSTQVKEWIVSNDPKNRTQALNALPGMLDNIVNVQAAGRNINEYLIEGILDSTLEAIAAMNPNDISPELISFLSQIFQRFDTRLNVDQTILNKLTIR